MCASESCFHIQLRSGGLNSLCIANNLSQCTNFINSLYKISRNNSSALVFLRNIWYNQDNHFNQAPTPSHQAFEEPSLSFMWEPSVQGGFLFAGSGGQCPPPFFYSFLRTTLYSGTDSFQFPFSYHSRARFPLL